MHPRKPSFHLFGIAAFNAVVLLSGCAPKSPQDIRVERVPKSESAPAPANPASGNASAMPGTSLAPALAMPARPMMQATPDMIAFADSNPTPKWAPPADWQADHSSQVRKGSWLVPPPADATDAPPMEIAVNVFQGQLGGLLANVNRWRGRAGLSADITAEQLPDNVQNITIGGLPAQYVTFDGPDGKSLDGALIFLPDRTWSFVLSGNTVGVKTQRAAFRAFLDGIEWPK